MKKRAAQDIIKEDEKYCCRCEKILPKENFGVNERIENGLLSYCKDCMQYKPKKGSGMKAEKKG
jgi:hypothetical protein